MLKLIAAVCHGGGIGVDGSIPWACRKDREYFRMTTLGHILIMGRVTADSCYPLEGRTVITISSNSRARGDLVVGSYPAAKRVAQYSAVEGQHVFVCGGERVYYAAIHDSNLSELHITSIVDHYECDRFFPEIDSERWMVDMVLPLTIGSFVRRYKRL